MAVLVLCFALVLARVGAFVGVLPLLGGGAVPRLVKVGLTVALTCSWFDTLFGKLAPEGLSASLQSSWPALGVAAGRELFLGALLGYAFGLFLLPARAAGEVLSQETGLSLGGLLDPLGGSSSSALPQLFEMLSIVLILGLDGHHLFLLLLHGSFTRYPVGVALPEVPVGHLVDGLAAAQEWGVVLAMPVAVYLFLTTVVLIILSRAAPQLTLYSIGFPLRIGVGLVALLLLLPNLTAGLLGSFGEMARWILGSG
jgi:flagellar biosynthetic protein FliR